MQLSRQTRGRILFWSALLYLLGAIVTFGVGLVVGLPLLALAVAQAISLLREREQGPVREQPFHLTGLAITALGVLLFAVAVADLLQQLLR